MFLFWNRIPRVTCNNRYYIYCCRILAFISVPFNRKSSSWFGIWNTLLTFCGCCMIISVSFSILLRIINNTFYTYNILLQIIIILVTFIKNELTKLNSKK